MKTVHIDRHSFGLCIQIESMYRIFNCEKSTLKMNIIKKKAINNICCRYVNRIDKRACGLVIYAKNREKLLQISEIINDKTIIEKKYLA